MKKVVTLGMVVAMSTALCFSVYADNSNTIATQKAANIKQGTITVASANPMKLETKTMKGTVKEINDFGIKINAEDNKVYVVPTGMISDTAEYKSMNLKIGDNITAEGLDFEKMKGSQEISFTLEENAAVLEDAVHITKAVPAAKAVPATKAVSGETGGNFVQTFEKADLFKLEENELLFPAEKITANGVTVELQKLMTGVAATEAVKIETKTIKGTVKEINDFGVKINGEDQKVYVIPTAMFAETKEFKAMNLKVGDSITVEGPDFEKMMGKMKDQKNIVYFGTPAVASAKAELKELPKDASLKDETIIIKTFDNANMIELDKDDIMFPAEKISANGVTLDINNIMKELHKPIQIKLSPKN